MPNKRTPDEEVARQLKIVSYQITPMAAFAKVGLWLAALLIGLGLLSMAFMGVHF